MSAQPPSPPLAADAPESQIVCIDADARDVAGTPPAAQADPQPHPSQDAVGDNVQSICSRLQAQCVHLSGRDAAAAPVEDAADEVGPLVADAPDMRSKRQDPLVCCVKECGPPMPVSEMHRGNAYYGAWSCRPCYNARRAIMSQARKPEQDRGGKRKEAQRKGRQAEPKRLTANAP